jgi:GNAT superfamily N-acetyltransferase
MTVDIVPFRPDHARAWHDLNEAWILAGGFAIEAKDRVAMEDPEGTFLRPGGAIFIAEQTGAAIGCCGLLRMADGGFEGAKMTVTPAARGQGVGRRLLDACEAAARAAGAPRLYLETNSGAAAAIALYRCFGFVDLPPSPSPYARCDVWMEKRL